MRRGTASVLVVGAKVLDVDAAARGIGEVASYPAADGMVKVRYFTSPTHFVERDVHARCIRSAEVPAQTRCFLQTPIGFRMGRVVMAKDASPLPTYQLAFPNHDLEVLPETDFHVRSYLSGSSAVDTLAGLGQETPFLYDHRHAFLSRYFQQSSNCERLLGLISSKIELFPHQVEIARRVLRDPRIRYLLADEVGLGKTVEAGLILRQLRLDSPTMPMAAFVPRVLVQQWRSELGERFDLSAIPVYAHEDLSGYRQSGGIVVIDEAHKVVDGPLFDDACVLTEPKKVPHLLLLSATPILHHEKQFLSLLHLLDPEAYDLSALSSFRERLMGRRELGRAVLALARTNRPAFVMRHIQRIRELLPHDSRVEHLSTRAAAAAAEADADAQLAPISTRLRAHLTETYRIHRRLLRTRRATLLEDGDITQQRQNRPPLYLDSPASLGALWEALEEWRIRAAAYVATDASRDSGVWIGRYLAMAAAIASTRRDLAVFACDARESFNGEREILEELRAHAAVVGLEPTIQVVVNFLASRRGAHERWLFFCPDAQTARDVAGAVKGQWPGRVCVVTEEDAVATKEAQLREFRDASPSALFTDSSLEEGANLQFASGLVLLDLPYQALRLEQRIGRLDRLDRQGTVECFAVLTHADSHVAVDSAWYEVLVRGLGLFEGSLADLQYLCERELKTLGAAVFEGGPQALLREIPRLAQLIATERETGAEQDILDGIDVSGLRVSGFWRNLEAADEAEQPFGEALKSYVGKSLNLSVRAEVIPGRPGSLFEFGLDRKRAPLLPASVLEGIAAHSDRKSTVSRTLATRSRTLEFLRPGHPFVEQLRVLAEWDDRGQAFAMWRRAPGLTSPTLVFRWVVRTGIPANGPTIEADGGAERPECEVLRRLAASWYPTRYWNILLDGDGRPVPERLASLCRKAYDNQFDINLGGDRSYILQELTSAEEWPRLTRRLAEGAIYLLRSHGGFLKAQASARQASLEYFATLGAHLQARAGDPNVCNEQLERELELNEQRAETCSGLLSAPTVSVDSCGVYVLSEDPVCPR